MARTFSLSMPISLFNDFQSGEEHSGWHSRISPTQRQKATWCWRGGANESWRVSSVAWLRCECDETDDEFQSEGVAH